MFAEGGRNNTNQATYIAREVKNRAAFTATIITYYLASAKFALSFTYSSDDDAGAFFVETAGT